MLAKARVRIQGIRKHQPMVIQIERRQDEPLTGDQIRRKIEALGGRLSLPTVKRALGMLEGEHRSIRRGTGYEFLDLRPYSSGDEARSIDWKASARAGRPMIGVQQASRCLRPRRRVTVGEKEIRAGWICSSLERFAECI